MRKLIIYLLCLLVLTSCSSPVEPEPEPEPIYYSRPIYVMTKKSGGLSSLDELKNGVLAVQTGFDREYSDYVLEQLSDLELTEDNILEASTYQELPNYINDGTIDAWILPEDYENVVADFRNDYNIDDYVVLAEYKKPYYEEEIVDEKILNDPLFTKPFAVMINGIDGRGDNDAKDLRNDVNHLMVVDPVKKHVLTISFPRDTYMYNTTYQYYDKMTHMNIYGGPETIIDSVGNTLDMEIDYYCVTSFSHFVDMINNFGGVWIDVPMDVYMDMDSYRNVANPYQMDKGYKKCYGEWALALARNRKYNGIANGDFSRIRNQALIINSIIQRVADHPYILDMMGMSWLCNYLTNNNFTDDQIDTLLYLAKTFEDGYTIDNYFIEAYDGYAGDAYVSYMIDESVEIAKGKVKLVMNGTIDKDNPYYEDIMTGYVTSGAGTIQDGDHGNIGTSYDLSSVYPQN